MKNTLVPLDMVFVDSRGVVHRVAQWTTPLSLEWVPSHGSVRAVIELRGGIAQRLGITRGSRIEHENFAAPNASTEKDAPTEEAMPETATE